MMWIHIILCIMQSCSLLHRVCPKFGQCTETEKVNSTTRSIGTWIWWKRWAGKLKNTVIEQSMNLSKTRYDSSHKANNWGGLSVNVSAHHRHSIVVITWFLSSSASMPAALCVSGNSNEKVWYEGVLLRQSARPSDVCVILTIHCVTQVAWLQAQSKYPILW